MTLEGLLQEETPEENSPREREESPGEEQQLQEKVQQTTSRWKKIVRNSLIGVLALAGGVIATRHIRPPNHHQEVKPGHSFPAPITQEQHTLLTYQGRILGTFPEEQKRDPHLTVDSYLELLAKALDTPEKLEAFLTTYTQHIMEEELPVPFVGGNLTTTRRDYWQSAEETAEKVELFFGRLKMLGDCEDLAFLAQAILQRQGKSAHVISISDEESGHATCVWVEKTSNGRYDGFSFDGYFDKNGRSDATRPVGTPPPESFGTVYEAVEATLRRYDRKASVNPLWIPVCRIRLGGIRHSDVITIQAFDPDHPIPISGIDIGMITGLFTSLFAAYRIRKWKKKTGKKNYFGDKEFWRPRLF